MLNPNLPIEELAQTWRDDDRVRIDNLLTPEAAGAVEQAMQALTYDLIFFSGSANRVATPEQLAQLSDEQVAQLQQELGALAREGTGFLYGGYRMDGERRDGAPNVLRELFDTVNGPLLDVVREVTGFDSLRSADGQFTAYQPGHYLTRHSDDVTAEGRRVAYVLGMTRAWHPDWGGLLQFFHNEGEPRDAWAPRFNSLSMFDVRHVHSVTFVAPFAGARRLSLTGWFREASSS